LDGDLVHIDDEAIEQIVENAFFDFKVWLGLSNEIEGGHKTSIAPRKPVENHKTRDEKSSDGKNRDRDKKLIKTDSRGFEGNNFAIS